MSLCLIDVFPFHKMKLICICRFLNTWHEQEVCSHLGVDGWNRHHFHIEHSSMVVHPLHPRERNLHPTTARTWYTWCTESIEVHHDANGLYKYNLNESYTSRCNSIKLWKSLLHQETEPSRTAVVFPETRGGRSVLFVGARSAAWGSTGGRRKEPTRIN